MTCALPLPEHSRRDVEQQRRQHAKAVGHVHPLQWRMIIAAPGADIDGGHPADHAGPSHTAVPGRRLRAHRPDIARISLAEKRITCLAVDYHNSILVTRGETAEAVDAEIRGHGYRRERGTPDTGYTVYVA